MQKPPGPPYAPQIWTLGGKPKASLDIPVTAVFLGLFIFSAVMHMTIYQLNNRRGHKFLMSALLFGFSMARVVTTVMRIASVSLPHDVPLAIAAQIFTAAGVVLLFIINLIFAQRIMRASHPTFGWHRLANLAFQITYALIVVVIIMVIIVTVQTFYTLNPNTRRIDRNIQLAGQTFFAVVSFLPIPIITIGLVLPRRHKLDKFGHGRWRTKIQILLLAAVLISFGASYRAGTSWREPVMMTQPMPVYMSKGAFYVANFTVEIIVLYLYAILRIDQRFHIPDGAGGYGSYSGHQEAYTPSNAPAGLRKEPEKEQDQIRDSVLSQSATLRDTGSPLRVYSEEETFDQDEWLEAKNREDIEKAQSPSESSWKEDKNIRLPPPSARSASRVS